MNYMMKIDDPDRQSEIDEELEELEDYEGIKDLKERSETMV